VSVQQIVTDIPNGRHASIFKFEQSYPTTASHRKWRL